MIVAELLNDLFTDRQITLTKALETRFQKYLFQYDIVMPVMEYLQYLENQGKIRVLTLPTGTTKLQRLYS
jgi:hypothetical protein